MHHIEYHSIAGRAMKQIEDGAFLMVQAGDKLNVMTIGWASIGSSGGGR